jgi:hypothetical protein
MYWLHPVRAISSISARRRKGLTPLSNIITTAFEGYRLLSVSGQDEALKDARNDLSARWAKTRRAAELEPA